MRQYFDPIAAWVISLEGGDHVDPRDPGGRTKYGISQAAHPKVNLDTLTLEGAKEIYLNEYWTPLRCDALPFPVDVVLFDTAVNQGGHLATLFLQALLPVAGDGQMGPDTTSAAMASNPQDLATRLLVQRGLWYCRDTAQEEYLAGWLRRLMMLATAIPGFTPTSPTLPN